MLPACVTPAMAMGLMTASSMDKKGLGDPLSAQNLAGFARRCVDPLPLFLSFAEVPPIPQMCGRQVQQCMIARAFKWSRERSLLLEFL